jgi:hypothetical protein
MEGADLAGLPSNEDEVNQYEKAKSACKIPVAYIWAILTGVTLISIIPASGIFWLFFRQEMGLYQHSDQLTMETNRSAQGGYQSLRVD